MLTAIFFDINSLNFWLQIYFKEEKKELRELCILSQGPFENHLQQIVSEGCSLLFRRLQYPSVLSNKFLGTIIY